jgi:hypothetical protein
MPSTADAQRCGRRNNTRMRYTESRNAATAPRQPARSRNLALYRPAAQKAIRNPGTGMIAQGTVVSAGGWEKPGHEDRYRGPADAYGQHSVFQAGQCGGTHLSITPECARRLEDVLVQSASAVGEETAEARDGGREHMPTR